MNYPNLFVVILAIWVAQAAASGVMNRSMISYFLTSLCLLAVLFKWWKIASNWMRSPAPSWTSSPASREIVKVNESLHQLHKPKGEVSPSMQVLFFHGFQFGSDYEKMHISTWESRDGSCIWPQTWLVEKFPNAHVFSISYSACVRKNMGQNGSFDLHMIAENLTYDLIEANIGQNIHCPVILVGHSFGGLVIKQVCSHVDKLHLKKDVKYKNFLKNIKGIFYYGTPHHGCPFIDKVTHLLSGPLLTYVQTLSIDAARLNEHFNDLRGLYSWRTEGHGEVCQTKLDGVQFMMIVPEASARSGCDLFTFAEDADHISVCKPPDPTSRSFRALENLLRKLENGKAPIDVTPPEDVAAVDVTPPEDVAPIFHSPDSYTIQVRIIQTEPRARYSIVEKTVNADGTWTEPSQVDGEQTLTMGSSGNSGMLRFTNLQGDYFLVALGVHNNKRWCDIVVDANSSDTGMKIHPTYDSEERGEMLRKQSANIEKTSSKGVYIKVDYYKESGRAYWATITISSPIFHSPSSPAMSYTTHVRIIHTKPCARYSIVEKTVWYYANGGTWSNPGGVDGEQTLSMGGSGTSGTLRFANPEGDYFLVALGVHNSYRWFDIVVDMNSRDTGVQIHPTYYGGGQRNGTESWGPLARTSSKSVCIKLDYSEDGSTCMVTITIS